MTPAKEIIVRLGGNKAVADLLGLERTAVQRWTYEPPKGLGNRVPPKHWGALVSTGKVELRELMNGELADIVTASAKSRKRVA